MSMLYYLTKIALSTRSADGEKQYPDYYGGSFIERDGTLTIRIKGDSLTGVKRIRSVVNSNIIRYKSCKYSYQELIDIMDDLSDKIDNTILSFKKNLSGMALNDSANTIDIYLVDCSPSKIAEFRNFYDHASFRFSQLDKITETSVANVCPGDTISLNTETSAAKRSYGSFAFRAKDASGNIGMVTAGHAVSIGTDYYYLYSGIFYTFGQCTKKTSTGSNADAAFVVSTGNFTLTNSVGENESNQLSTTTSLPGAGTYVNKWGATTGRTGGYIKSTTFKVYDDDGNLKYTNMTSAQYDSDNGDSGGIVYTLKKAPTTTSTDIRYTVGVHYGRSNNLGIYSKATNVLNALELTRY